MRNKLRNFWYNLSSNQRFLIRKLYYFPIDFYDKLTGKTHQYVPSRGNIYTGSPDSAEGYLKQGKWHLKLLQQHIDLRPTDSVLDIGSGVGRTAIALTEYLNNVGEYQGFDVVEAGVNWCNNGIGKDFQNFQFTYVPLYNDLYNTSAQKATEFKFPYNDQYFDKIFTFSVYTHMMINEIQHYLTEMNRVLKDDGAIFSTFFLYDDQDEASILENKSFHFGVKKEGYRLMSDHTKSGNIAIYIDNLKKMANQAGLEVVKIEKGFWRTGIRRQAEDEFQDVVIFKKI